jgi:hypothetical protein
MTRPAGTGRAAAHRPAAICVRRRTGSAGCDRKKSADCRRCRSARCPAPPIAAASGRANGYARKAPPRAGRSMWRTQAPSTGAAREKNANGAPCGPDRMRAALPNSTPAATQAPPAPHTRLATATRQRSAKPRCPRQTPTTCRALRLRALPLTGRRPVAKRVRLRSPHGARTGRFRAPLSALAAGFETAWKRHPGNNRRATARPSPPGSPAPAAGLAHPAGRAAGDPP